MTVTYNVLSVQNFADGSKIYTVEVDTRTVNPNGSTSGTATTQQMTAADLCNAGLTQYCTSTTGGSTSLSFPTSNSGLYYLKYQYGSNVYELIDTAANLAGPKWDVLTSSGTGLAGVTVISLLPTAGPAMGPRVAVNGYTPPPDTSPIPTFTVSNVTIQAANGTQASFVVLGSAWNSLQASSSAIPTGQIISFSNANTTNSPQNTTTDILNFLAANPQAITAVKVTVLAINGNTQVFYIPSATWSAFQASGGLQQSQISAITNIPNYTGTFNTTNDIANFLTSNSTGGTTPNPTPVTPTPTGLTATVTNGDIALNWTSQYPITLTMNGVTVVNNYAANAYTRFGQANGTYTFTMFATNPANNVNSTAIQVVANVNYTPPPPTNPTPNYSYNIQIPNVANALQLITSTNYGTTASISFPAQTFVKNVLNQTVPSIPNTLNALFIANVANTPNDSAVATALIGYFPPVTTPPPVGNPLQIQGNKFTSLITLLGAIFLFKK